MINIKIPTHIHYLFSASNFPCLLYIPDYVWQQDNDGGVFLGSWQDSQWTGFEIELDHRETLGQSATAVQIAIDAEIRPGTVINEEEGGKKQISMLADAEEVEEFKALCEQMGLSKPKALKALMDFYKNNQ